MTPDKFVTTYEQATFDPAGQTIGATAHVVIASGGGMNLRCMAGPITSYDETTAIFETEEAVFVPAGS